jgi:hypothetical protein
LLAENFAIFSIRYEPLQYRRDFRARRRAFRVEQTARLAADQAFRQGLFQGFLLIG